MRISYWCSYLCSSDRVHALLDGRKVGGREGGLPGEVVVEAVFDGRAEGDLGAGIEFLHRLGQDVGAVVAQQLKRVCVAGRDDLYRRVAIDRPGEVAQGDVDLHGERRPGGAGARGTGDPTAGDSPNGGAPGATR